jgi:hypothetical protein
MAMASIAIAAQDLSVGVAEKCGPVAAAGGEVIGSEQPQVQATCDGVPIKRFRFCWVLGEAPDLLDDVTFQLGNANPRVNVHPKDSRQIKRNCLGVTTTRMPRSTENDYLPLEAIHLKAKYVAQVFTRHTALEIESFFCEMYFPQFGVLDLSLLRRSFDADPISPLQPQAAYYLTRNLATMLDELEPAEFEYTLDRAPSNLEAFKRSTPGGPALAFWLGGRAQDRCEGVSIDVRLQASARKATAYDPVNGVAQELIVTQSGTGQLLKGILVRDWPLIIRLSDECSS